MIKRPDKISDKDWYEMLETFLFQISSAQPLAKLYRGINKQLEDLAAMLNEDIEIEDKDDDGNDRILKVKLMSYKSMSASNDKAVERFIKIVDSLPKLIETQSMLENKLSPETMERLDALNTDENSGVLEKALKITNG
jgi:hypothetical protein